MATVSTAAGSVATIESLTTENKTFYEMVLLNRAIGRYYHCNLCVPSRIPAKKGGTVEWRKVSSLSEATTPLVEGVTPAGQAASIVNQTATPLQYGAYIRHSDHLDLIGLDPMAKEFSEILGEQAGLTADTLARTLMVASGTAQIVDSVALRTSLAATNTIAGGDITKAWATLTNVNALPFEFLGGRYAVIISAFGWEDLLNSSDFRNAAQEAKPRSDEHPFFSGQVFDFMGCRFFITSQAYKETDGGASSVDAYVTMVIGKGAFGIAGIGDEWIRMEMGMGGTGKRVMPVNLINHQLGTGGPSDPLNQRASIGWTGFQQEKELDSTLMVRIEHACSSGSN